MLLLNLASNPLVLFSFLFALVLAITIHEFSHAFVANSLGDPTAKYQGRITLNPLAHLDPVGTLLLLIVGFGWGRPVPINPQYFTRPAFDELLVALSGPASNFIIAAVAGFLTRFTGDSLIITQILAVTVEINVVLMLFNLIPIPPLDGSKIFRVFLGENAFRTLESYSLPLILILMFLLQASPLGNFLSSAISQLANFFVSI